MNYFIKRDDKEYGPYSLADLQKYVASGNVLLTDLCRSEGLMDWVPVSQVIGNIPVPVAATQPAAGTVYGAPAAYGAPAGYAAPAVSQYPPPPSLHWGILVLLGVLTCGIFGWVWAFIQAAWVKKVQPESKALIYYGIAVGLFVLIFGGAFMAGVQGQAGASREPIFLLLRLGGGIMWLVAAFNMRSSIEDHFNSAEPIGLSLNGVMTFFFSIYYFQYHFTRINEMKQRQMAGYPR
ncbi:MAG TPA: GYF domain-containing protein [Candidatus Acidoferrum sp.]